MSTSTQAGFRAVPRRKLVDEVLDQLQALIASGRYPSGAKLPPEPELMKLLQVGRSTVREAVKILVHAGLLEVRQGDGTYVKASATGFMAIQPALIPQKYEQLLEVRAILEIEAAGLAALRRTDEDLHAMRTRLDQRNEALEKGRYAEYVEKDILFHLAIAEASHNEVLLAVYQGIAQSLRSMLSQLILDTSRYEDNTIYHEAIYMAIKAGDSQGARKYTIQNLNAVSAARKSLTGQPNGSAEG